MNSRFMKVLLAALLVLLVGTYVSASNVVKVEGKSNLSSSVNKADNTKSGDSEASAGDKQVKEINHSSTDYLSLIIIVIAGLAIVILLVLISYDNTKEGFLQSIKLKIFSNIKPKASKEHATVIDDNDSKLDNTSTTESDTTTDPLNNNTEATSEVDNTKEQTTEEGSTSSDLKESVAKQSNAIKEVKTDLSTLIKKVNDMTQTFMSLQKSLDEKDEEIKRLKIGYDADIYRSFLLRFTRVDKVLKEYMSEGQIDLKGLEDIHIQMEDALAECDVEPFLPELGSDYKTSQGVADNPVIKDTANKKEDSTIAEVLQVGYRRRLPDEAEEEFQIITQAKVVIYVYKKPENN